jgi:hypothetical protein
LVAILTKNLLERNAFSDSAFEMNRGKPLAGLNRLIGGEHPFHAFIAQPARRVAFSGGSKTGNPQDAMVLAQ